MQRLLVAAVAALCASGCAITRPVAVIGQRGEIFRGTVTASVSGGSFSVSNGKTNCAGDYNAWDTSTTITMPVLCSDGRRGIVTATRDNSGMNGGGRVRLSDGTEADFIFGDAAARI